MCGGLSHMNIIIYACSNLKLVLASKVIKSHCSKNSLYEQKYKTIMTRTLNISPLTAAAFAPFGEVIEMAGAEHFPINQGTTERYHDLAKLDLNAVGGKSIVSIFETQPRPLPIKLDLMERHPLGSQAFYPLQDRDWLIVVAGDPDPVDIDAPDNLRAFRANGRQGVNYARNVWHHPLLVLDSDSRFLIVDRKGPGNNLEEIVFTRDVYLSDA